MALPGRSYEYIAIVTKVVDGDTFDLTADLGFHTYYQARVRLLNIDTPELRASTLYEKEHARIAKAFAEQELLNKTVFLRSYKMGAYGRWEGEIKYLGPDGSLLDFREQLIAHGLIKKEKYE